MAEIVQVEGLRDLMVALKTVNAGLYAAVGAGLQKAGDLVADDARARFTRYDRRSASNFEARVRPTTEASVFIGQRLRKTTGLRPDWGALQVREALLPARSEQLDAAAEVVEVEVIGLMRANGF